MATPQPAHDCDGTRLHLGDTVILRGTVRGALRRPDGTIESILVSVPTTEGRGFIQCGMVPEQIKKEEKARETERAEDGSR